MGDTPNDPLHVDFDRQIKLEFHGSTVTSDAGLLAENALGGAVDSDRPPDEPRWVTGPPRGRAAERFQKNW